MRTCRLSSSWPKILSIPRSNRPWRRLLLARLNPSCCATKATRVSRPMPRRSGCQRRLIACKGCWTLFLSRFWAIIWLWRMGVMLISHETCTLLFVLFMDVILINGDWLQGQICDRWVGETWKTGFSTPFPFLSFLACLRANVKVWKTWTAKRKKISVLYGLLFCYWPLSWYLFRYLRL